MKRTSIILITVAAAAVLLVGTCAVQYNGLVTSSETVDASWSQVQNQLQRRADLIPNLVETVKGYAAHEKEIFTEIANARAKLIGAKTPDQAEAAESSMNSALGRLLVISERYPDLKANEQFSRLQDELAGTENRISVERMRYNETVRTFNTKLKRFPTNLFAGVTGFSARDYFEAPATAQDVPKVDFSGR